MFMRSSLALSLLMFGCCCSFVGCSEAEPELIEAAPMTPEEEDQYEEMSYGTGAEDEAQN